MKPIRHGEIMLVPCDALPSGKTASSTSYIVGHSETGHHHVLESKSEFEVLTTEDKDLYFRLFDPASLVHKKATDQHRTLTISPGIYKRYHDTEYNPFEKIIEDVRD